MYIPRPLCIWHPRTVGNVAVTIHRIYLFDCHSKSVCQQVFDEQLLYCFNAYATFMYINNLFLR